MPDIKTIADKADIIVNGYAFTRQSDGIHVLNLNRPDKAIAFNSDGEVLETTMDDIEISIASRYRLLPLFHILLCSGVYARPCQR